MHKTIEDFVHVDKPNFFTNQELKVFKFYQIKQYDLNQVLNEYDINVVSILKDKINNIWKGKALNQIQKNKKSMKITNSDLSMQSQWFKKILNGFKRQGNYLFILKMLKFKFERLINPMIFATMDEEQWKSYRKKTIKKDLILNGKLIIFIFTKFILINFNLNLNYIILL